MKKFSPKIITLFTLVFLLSFQAIGQKAKKKDKSTVVDTINIAIGDGESLLEFTFKKGEEFNHPTFAIWIEDLDGNYLETVFVTQSFATGTFGNADAGDGTWKSTEGESIRPAALPYWAHKRNIVSRDGIYVPTQENPVADAISGPTPTGNFILRSDIPDDLKGDIKVLFEINQTWDWNDYWTNNKYPGDKDYKSSSQPSIVYAGMIKLKTDYESVQLLPIGHGHYSGDDGSLTEDLSTLTTALEITNQINVSITTKK